MRVVIRLSGAQVRKNAVPDIKRLRNLQEERLSAALASWEEEKKRLEEAVARAETKEREFHEVSEDVRQKLSALDLVALLESELMGGLPAQPSLPPPESESRPALPAPQNEAGGTAEDARLSALLKPGMPESVPVDAVVHRSSRPLFSPERRARAGVLSILP